MCSLFKPLPSLFLSLSLAKKSSCGRRAPPISCGQVEILRQAAEKTRNRYSSTLVALCKMEQ